jgi:hypothetical protein
MVSNRPTGHKWAKYMAKYMARDMARDMATAGVRRHAASSASRVMLT